MFFRRVKPVVPAFAERLARLREHGFQIEAGSGKARVSRDGCAADVADRGEQPPEVSRAGVLVHGEIGRLVDQGFQKSFQTPSGRRVAALARHLRALHSFEEDLKEGLGLKSLYNESLGTVNDLHLYDRVAGRDAGPRRKPWDQPRT